MISTCYRLRPGRTTDFKTVTTTNETLKAWMESRPAAGRRAGAAASVSREIAIETLIAWA